jgi:hypothetical protein
LDYVIFGIRHLPAGARQRLSMSALAEKAHITAEQRFARA